MAAVMVAARVEVMEVATVEVMEVATAAAMEVERVAAMVAVRVAEMAAEMAVGRVAGKEEARAVAMVVVRVAGHPSHKSSSNEAGNLRLWSRWSHGRAADFNAWPGQSGCQLLSQLTASRPSSKSKIKSAMGTVVESHFAEQNSANGHDMVLQQPLDNSTRSREYMTFPLKHEIWRAPAPT